MTGTEETLENLAIAVRKSKMKNNWKDKFYKMYSDGETMHTDYINFIESLLTEQKKELAEKTEIELRRILSIELPILEEKIRTEQKKRGRPVGSKTRGATGKATGTKNVLTWKGYQDYKDFTPIEAPTPKEPGMHRGNEIPLIKTILVLTLVNVAILISLIVKNI